jgi:hypothetical protein
MYLERAEVEDEKMINGWKADIDGILIFVSAHVTSTLPMLLRKHRQVYSLLLSRHS